MLVKVIMRTPVATIRADDMVHDAEAVMARECLRHLPVVDERDALCGVLTERGVARARPSTLPRLARWEWSDVAARVPVGAAMIRDTTAVTPSTPLSEAACLMVRRRSEALPVLDDRQVVGLVSARDLLAVVLRERECEGAAGPRRVVACVAAGARGGGVLDVALEVVRRHRSALTVVHTLTPWACVEATPIATAMIEETARTWLVSQLPEDVRDAVRVIVSAVGGTAVIVRAAEHDEADLIVADAEAAPHLMRVAPCAVLAVPFAREVGNARR